MNSNYRIAATLFHGDLVCFRNINVNTLHKGDDDGDGGGGGGGGGGSGGSSSSSNNNDIMMNRMNKKHETHTN
jgi:hypothetical protein